MKSRFGRTAVVVLVAGAGQRLRPSACYLRRLG